MNESLTDLRDILVLMQKGQWNTAHDRVQHQQGLLAAWLHGLLHLQEGDLEDAENWYDRGGQSFRQRGSLQEELKRFEVVLDEQCVGSLSAKHIGKN